MGVFPWGGLRGAGVCVGWGGGGQVCACVCGGGGRRQEGVLQFGSTQEGAREGSGLVLQPALRGFVA